MNVVHNSRDDRTNKIVWIEQVPRTALEGAPRMGSLRDCPALMRH